MSYTVCYFTGSGNSLSIARRISNRFSDSKLLSIASAVSQNESVNSETVILVFPVYMHRTPKIVVRFLKQLQSVKKIIAVATYGGSQGVVFQQIQKLLKKSGEMLHAGYALRMPDNYTPFGPPPEGEKLDEMNQRLEESFEEMLHSISNGEEKLDDTTSFWNKYVWPGPFFYLGYLMIPQLDRSFAVSEKCNNCGVCEKVCPVNNIEMKEGQPQWNQKCEQCFACVHWCGNEAIEYGKKTVGVARYRHQEVSLKDIIAQKGE